MTSSLLGKHHRYPCVLIDWKIIDSSGRMTKPKPGVRIAGYCFYHPVLGTRHIRTSPVVYASCRIVMTKSKHWFRLGWASPEYKAYAKERKINLVQIFNYMGG